VFPNWKAIDTFAFQRPMHSRILFGVVIRMNPETFTIFSSVKKISELNVATASKVCSEPSNTPSFPKSEIAFPSYRQVNPSWSQSPSSFHRYICSGAVAIPNLTRRTTSTPTTSGAFGGDFDRGGNLPVFAGCLNERGCRTVGSEDRGCMTTDVAVGIVVAHGVGRLWRYNRCADYHEVCGI